MLLQLFNQVLDIEIKEKPVFPRMTEVVLERTFEIEEAKKIVDMRES